MSEEAEPLARRVRTRWPGLIWAFPLAALIVVGYLAVDALARRGTDVVITFPRADGVSPGNTKVVVSGVEVGEVRKVRIAGDGRHVEVTLRLDPREDAALNSATRFWLLGEHPTLTDASSIRASLVGVVVTMAPGRGGRATRIFDGLDQPPAILPGARGTSFFLETSRMGSIDRGAPVANRGHQIGKVVDTRMIGLDRFRIGVFIDAPWDRLVRTGSRFWSGSPLKLSLSGGGLSSELASPTSVLQGQIWFDVPYDQRSGPRAAAGASFPLFEDQDAAEAGPTGPEIPYRLLLAGAAGALHAEAPVTLAGYGIGRVRSARLTSDADGLPATDAIVVLYPRRLGVGDGGTPAGLWRSATDQAVGRLLARGFRASLAQSPPLIGSMSVELRRVRALGSTTLASGSGVPIIPSAKGAGGDLVGHADRVLDRIDALPLETIASNVRRLTGNLAGITGSPRVRDSVVHLDGTLRQLDLMLSEVRPRVGPLLEKLDEAAEQISGTASSARAVLSGVGAEQDSSLPSAIRQLDATARSIRTLTDYLGRHPEALIRGKRKEKR